MKTAKKSIRKFPASALQKQFWLICRMQPETSAYHVVEVFSLKGNPDVISLEKSINEIISRHEIFRTYFSFDEGELVQNVLPDLQLTIGRVDLIDDANRPTEANSFLQKEIEQPFDLGACPLIRVTVLRLQPEAYLLIFTLHHIITDLETMALFGKELSQFYRAYVKNEPLLIDKPPYQYSDYATWQGEWLRGDQSAAMNGYWYNQLAGVGGVLHLPADKKRPAVQSLKGGAHPIQFSPSFTEELKQFSRQHTVNLFLTLLTAYVVILSPYCGQNDIIVGVPLTNRRQSRHKSIMGCFSNPLPLVVSVAGDPAFKDLLHRVRLAMLGAHRNQETPFAQILDKVKPARNAGYNPLYQVGFAFQPPMSLVLEDLGVEPVFVHHGGAQLDLFAFFWESHAGLEGFWEYNADIFEKWKIVSFADNFRSLLKSVMADAARSISSLSVISELEKRKMMVDRNATQVDSGEIEARFVAPSGEQEKKMAGIWQRLLKVEGIGVHDNFFLSGGSSLLCVQMIARIREEFNVDIRVAKLFQFPTIRSLVNCLNKNENNTGISNPSDRAELRKKVYTRKRGLMKDSR